MHATPMRQKGGHISLSFDPVLLLFLPCLPFSPPFPGFYEGAIYTGEEAAKMVGALLRKETA